MALNDGREAFLTMNLEFYPYVAPHLRSRSQQARVVTEAWFDENGYCVACDSDFLLATKPNTVVHDFTCEKCRQKYELKSSSSPQSKRVPDGAYLTMISKIREGEAPSLVLLRYRRGLAEASNAWVIAQLTAIHPVFLTEVTIEARPKLGPTAKRAGWQGCNIRLDRMPSDGLIKLVSENEVIDKFAVRSKYASAQKFTELNTDLRGWASLTLAIVRRLANVFTLQQIYTQQGIVREAFPNNRNVEAKLRQQLQLLRDLGYIQFLGRGRYAVVDNEI